MQDSGVLSIKSHNKLDTIKGTHEAIDKGLIKIIKVINNDKIPLDKGWQKEEPRDYADLSKHKGNFGLLIGYNHEKNNKSISCIDIDGFKPVQNNINLLSDDKEEAYNNLSEEEKEVIALESKEYIFNILKKAYPNALHVRTQSGGYHIIIFNKKIEKGTQVRLISHMLKFPSDYKCELLRDVNLGDSIECFTEPNKQIVLAGSTVNNKEYTLLDSGVQSWNDLGTVKDINSSLKESLLNNGFSIDKSKDSKPKTKSNNDKVGTENNDLVNIVAKILDETRGAHNDTIMCLTNIISNYYDNETTALIISDGLRLINDCKNEHIKQVNTCLNDNRINKYGIPTLKDKLSKNTKYLIDNLEEALKEDGYINLNIVNGLLNSIEQEGFVPFVTKNLNNVYLGEKKGLLKVFLACFNTINGKASHLLQGLSDSEEGKSYLHKTVLQLIPEKNVNPIDTITKAAFERLDNTFFNRNILYFRDLGGKNSDDETRGVFDNAKKIITENSLNSLKCDQNLKPEFMEIETEAFSLMYETVMNNFNDNDSQLESRTLSTTPPEVDKRQIAYFSADLDNSNSKVRKDYDKSIKELNKIRELVKYYTNKDIEIIINHFKAPMYDYCSKSDKHIRVFKMNMELFKAYCLMNIHECIQYDGVYLATYNQFVNFFDDVMEESVLKPIEYNFITMLKNKGSKIKLCSNVNKYLGNCYCDAPISKEYDDEYQTQLEDEYFDTNKLEVLNDSELKKIINLLIKNYGVQSKEPLFFTVNTLKQKYKHLKEFKDVKDISQMLNRLYILGYLDKLDYKRNYGGHNENVYYLTKAINDLESDKPEYISEDDIIELYKESLINNPYN